MKTLLPAFLLGLCFSASMMAMEDSKQIVCPQKFTPLETWASKKVMKERFGNTWLLISHMENVPGDTRKEMQQRYWLLYLKDSDDALFQLPIRFPLPINTFTEQEICGIKDLEIRRQNNIINIAAGISTDNQIITKEKLECIYTIPHDIRGEILQLADRQKELQISCKLPWYQPNQQQKNRMLNLAALMGLVGSGAFLAGFVRGNNNTLPPLEECLAPAFAAGAAGTGIGTFIGYCIAIKSNLEEQHYEKHTIYKKPIPKPVFVPKLSYEKHASQKKPAFDFV